jgi:uncharacterized metal-binding protein YceD (DUF177 family)
VKGECFVLLKNTSADKKKPASQDESEEEENDFSFNDSTEEIDIRSAIFDEILLSLPLKPLCSDACLGIEIRPDSATEQHKAESSDPRWENLKKIRFKPSAPHQAPGNNKS